MSQSRNAEYILCTQYAWKDIEVGFGITPTSMYSAGGFDPGINFTAETMPLFIAGFKEVAGPGGAANKPGLLAAFTAEDQTFLTVQITDDLTTAGLLGIGTFGDHASVVNTDLTSKLFASTNPVKFFLDFGAAGATKAITYFQFSIAFTKVNCQPFPMMR